MDMRNDIATNLSPLEQRRAALRALSDDIMETIKTLPKPQSWLEGDRAMRCLGTADRVTVQLFTKVKAHTPAGHRQTTALSIRPAAPVRAPETEAPFVYSYDDDEIDAGDMPAEDSDGATLDAALDDMEALLDAMDRGETPAPAKRPAKPTATTGRDTPYQNLAQTFGLGRDLLMELNATPP
ncbi:hypothetical protein [Asticcacaulis sp.]|uniref:hypothetical protein n=1 Tax=Asticcacaulis sp. TaxID=1872648 RepID=UPI002C0AABD1|nr:hypothetical protein [Asticcacaulis sp.]HTM81863.1 hypothetical protein [Asticcacaulis sp.]